jgi:hypothetical protein
MQKKRTFLATFSTFKGDALILTKNYWATIWAIFSLIHRVTLLVAIMSFCCSETAWQNRSLARVFPTYIVARLGTKLIP